MAYANFQTTDTPQTGRLINNSILPICPAWESSIRRQLEDGGIEWGNRGVDRFVAAKASNFNRIQQGSTSRLQTIQHQSLRINKNPQISMNAGIWFGTRSPVVQIHSPRPILSMRYLELLVLRLQCCRRFCRHQRLIGDRLVFRIIGHFAGSAVSPGRLPLASGCLLRESRKARILFKSSALRIPPKAGILVPPFTIRIVISSGESRSRT